MKVFSFLSPMVAHAVTISTAIPGTNANSSSSSPGAFVANFYQFALIIGGILAFGVIVYGGVKYMMSAGNPSALGDAKEWVEAALLGLLLLAGAYFVLKVVNPQLLNLNLPSLSPATVATSPTTATTGSGSPSTIQSSNDNSACGASNPTGVCPNVAGVQQVCANAGGSLGYVCQTPK